MWSKKDTPQRKRANGLDYIEIPGDPDAPTLLLLHGFGADLEDLASLSTAYTGKRKPTWILPNGPDKVQISFFATGRSWFKINIPALQQAFQNKDYEALQKSFPDTRAIREQLEGFLVELNIAPHNLILGGFSQGAVLATELALHAFERPLGLLVFSGVLVNHESWSHLASQKGGLSFFQSHGTKDPLLPLELAAQLETLFLQNHFQGKLHTFEGGHEIPLTILTQMDHFLKKIIL